MKSWFLALLVLVLAATAQAGTVSGVYTDLPLATEIDLSQPDTVDWVKWGNGEQESLVWSTVRQSSGPQIIDAQLTPLGTPPPKTSVELVAFSEAEVLILDWDDGDDPEVGSADTVVTETILPVQFDYPLGLGASFQAGASAEERVLDVFVQGFNANMRVMAEMSGGGSDSAVVAATKNPPSDPTNNYSSGVYRITYAGEKETLTVSVNAVAPLQPGKTQNFPNAGFFAARVVPEPAHVGAVGVLAVLALARRARRRTQA